MIPFLLGTTSSDNKGTAETQDCTMQKIPTETVIDGLIVDEESRAASTTSSANASPSVVKIETLIKLVPDAENAFFTDTGRLFVTDGTCICEITDRGTVTKLFTDTQGLFGGIAQSGKWLYVVHASIKNTLPSLDFNSLLASGDIVTILKALTDAMMNKEILRADISVAGPPVFESLCVIEGALLPNGMAADVEGNLYVADQTFLPQGGIIKFTITGDETPVVSQERWIYHKDGCLSPNGVAISGSTLYFTDFALTSLKPAKVKKVEIINGKPGTIEVVHSALSFFDDLDIGVYKNRTYIAVADYLLSSIIMINQNDGAKTRLGSGKLANPSSVHFGKTPQFKANELLVTEKGMLYEMYSSYGNKLSCITLPE